MSEATLIVQKAIRGQLIGDDDVTALVPAGAIIDRNALPTDFPSIILGEAEVVDQGEDLQRSIVRVHSTLHVWARERGLEQAKTIAGAMTKALRRSRFVLLDDPDFVCRDQKVSSARFLRDPDGQTSHGVIVVDSLLVQNWVLTL